MEQHSEAEVVATTYKKIPIEKVIFLKKISLEEFLIRDLTTYLQQQK